MANLYPDGYEEEVITASETEESTVIGYRPGAAFDYDGGDFIRDGKGKVIDADGVTSWQSWCINNIQTERYKHMAYNSDFAIELEKAMKANSRDEAESILTRQITEALLADPYGRTKYVESIEFDWIVPDGVIVQVRPHGIDDSVVNIEAHILKGG